MYKMVKLDLRDKKILYELDTNSRQSFREIGYKVMLSKDSVAYRINKLQRIGIIKQFQTVVDVSKLGFISFRLYLKLQNVTPRKEQEIINWLKNQEIVTWLVSIDGDYDLGMWILAKSPREANKLWKELHERYVNYIDHHSLTIFTKIVYFPRAYILGKEKNLKQFIFVSGSKKIKLDAVDMKILRLLVPNSRVMVSEIAEKLKMTPKTISYRIRKLERKGVILGYRMMFDLEKLGYQYFKVHFSLHNITKEKEKEVRHYIRRQPNIIYDNEVLGGDDIEIDVQVKNLPEFRKVIQDIKKKFAGIIKDYKQMIFYQEHKYVFLPG